MGYGACGTEMKARGWSFGLSQVMWLGCRLPKLHRMPGGGEKGLLGPPTWFLVRRIKRNGQDVRGRIR
jgi:hypothetical protein